MILGDKKFPFKSMSLDQTFPIASIASSGPQVTKSSSTVWFVNSGLVAKVANDWEIKSLEGWNLCLCLFSKVFLVNFLLNDQCGKCEEETGIDY